MSELQSSRGMRLGISSNCLCSETEGTRIGPLLLLRTEILRGDLR